RSTRHHRARWPGDGVLPWHAAPTGLLERYANATGKRNLGRRHAISATLAHDQASEVMGNAIQAFVGGTQLMVWATFSLAVLAIVIARRT
ncbi:hypothetical protein ACQX17_11460, partial [Corynebacterium diphtheriae]